MSENRAPRRVLVTVVIALLLLLVLVVSRMGVYTIQPIGALPKGITLIVWRAPGDPVFDSPDAACLRRLGSVSLMCRATALIAAPIDRIILRLPYVRWAYLISTGGKMWWGGRGVMQ